MEQSYLPYLVILIIFLSFLLVWALYKFLIPAPPEPNSEPDALDQIIIEEEEQVCKDDQAEEEDTITIDRTPILPERFEIEKKTIQPGKKGKKFMSRGEAICKETMERIYGVPFENTRPDFLRNPETNKTLELDCYNEELKIAVEYNGEQHYRFPNVFHKYQRDFEQQLRRDEFKAEMCKLHGIYLIVVPYNVPYDQIPEYIESQLPSNRY